MKSGFDREIRIRDRLIAGLMLCCAQICGAQTNAPAAPAPAGAVEGLSQSGGVAAIVQAGEETTLSSQMAGKIKKVNYGLGDNVAAKAVILEFDCEEQDAQLGTRRAGVGLAKI